MIKQGFLKGMGLGMAAGAFLGFQAKSREKKIKRSVGKAARSMENVIDSMGLK